jgi:hypothetical protein
MTIALTPHRPSEKIPADDAAAKLFWESAQRVAELAEAMVGAPRALLIDAGARSHGQAMKADALAEELGFLSDKIEVIRRRLGVKGREQVPELSRQNAVQAMRKLVLEGILVAPAAFVAMLNVSRQALSKALKAHRVFFVEVDGERYFPAFFADARLERRQVEQVSQALGELPGSSKLQFFLNPKASMEGLTPIESLAADGYSRVKIAAQGFAER